MGAKVTPSTITVHVYFLFLLTKNNARKRRQVFYFPWKRLEATGYDNFLFFIYLSLKKVSLAILTQKRFQYILK